MKDSVIMLIASSLLALAGCATTTQDNRLDQKQLLAFSGFTLRIAESPESLDQLSKIPQRQLLRYMSGDQQMYIWVDATGCRCWYAGDEAAYLRLLGMGWGGKINR